MPPRRRRPGALTVPVTPPHRGAPVGPLRACNRLAGGLKEGSGAL